MANWLWRMTAILGALAAILLPGVAQAAQAQAPEPAGLTAFANERALRAYLREIAAWQRREQRLESSVPLPPPPPPTVQTSTPSAGIQGFVAADNLNSLPQAIGITNNQVADVDEGDIVKLRGDILVILRRGRLFTVSLAGGGIRPVSFINAFPPGVDGSGDWYDEMLISGERVIVIGYSYARGGTQVNRFHLDADGRLAFEDSYQLRSNDYYSSRNYASRLIGTRLIAYAPLYLELDSDVLESFPTLRQWQPGRTGGQFKRIASANRVYLPDAIRDFRAAHVDTLHTVTSCDLAAAVLDCDATVVLGSEARTFFVSNNAVYLWIDDAWIHSRRYAANSFLYRMPLDGSRPQALQVRGAPVDQFSFLPDPACNMLHVVVRSDGGGDAMWRPEVTDGAVALLEFPTALFGDGTREVPLGRYLPLPKPHGRSWDFHNRFVGDHLLYAGGSTGEAGVVTVVSLADHRIASLPVAHGIDRIDALGPDGIVIGAGRAFLGFTAINLGRGGRGGAGAGVGVGETFRLADAREGETRSHAFFFHPDRDSADGSAGTLGLPVARMIERPGERDPRPSAALLFLSRRERRLAQAGELAAQGGAGEDSDDGCQASCVDWYGNARPIFIGERVFALLGYELVEGATQAGRIREIGRTSFAPAAAPRR
jgi:hypothetical protein